MNGYASKYAATNDYSSEFPAANDYASEFPATNDYASEFPAANDYAPQGYGSASKYAATNDYASEFPAANDYSPKYAATNDYAPQGYGSASKYAATNDYAPQEYGGASQGYGNASQVYSGASQGYSRLEKAYGRSEKPRAQLAQPEITFMQATGPHEIVVKWNAVPNAASYSFKYSTDPNVMLDVEAKYPHANETQVTLDALLPDTTYYAHIKANAGAGNTESAYSIIKAATTPVAGSGGGGDGGEGDSEIAADLRLWLSNLKGVYDQFSVNLPSVGNSNLSPAERRRMLGAGFRRYGYFDKISDTAAEWPQFWPAYGGDQVRLKELIRELEVLRNLLVFFEMGTRSVTDMILVVSNEAFRLANMYYRSVRTAARDCNPEAEAVFQQLREFWRNRRRMMGEPTNREMRRDLNGVLNGTKTGTVAATNEGESVAKGVKTRFDETRNARRVAGRSYPDSAGRRTERYDEPYDEPDDEQYDFG